VNEQPIAVPWRRSKRRLSEFGEIERWCRTCQDWWPDVAEFWYNFGRPQQQCKACQDVRTNRWRREHRQGKPQERRVIVGPAVCRCGTVDCEGRAWLKPHPDRRKPRVYVWEHVA